MAPEGSNPPFWIDLQRIAATDLEDAPHRPVEMAVPVRPEEPGSRWEATRRSPASASIGSEHAIAVERGDQDPGTTQIPPARRHGTTPARSAPGPGTSKDQTPNTNAMRRATGHYSSNSCARIRPQGLFSHAPPGAALSEAFRDESSASPFCHGRLLSGQAGEARRAALGLPGQKDFSGGPLAAPTGGWSSRPQQQAERNPRAQGCQPFLRPPASIPAMPATCDGLPSCSARRSAHQIREVITELSQVFSGPRGREVDPRCSPRPAKRS